MTRRILVFGATGYTGELTARSVVRQGARPVLVARNPQRVAALAQELGGLDVAVADAEVPGSLEAVVSGADVLVSTVGPFLRFGEPAARVAAQAGAHYLDSTGEGPFLRRVFERWGPVAAGNGAAMLSAFGFDYVPGALAGGLALQAAGPDAVRVEIGYFVRNFGTSGGTQASIAQMMLEDGFAFRDGVLARERAGAKLARFAVDGKTLTGVSIPCAEHLGLPAAFPQLHDVNVYLGAPPAVARGMAVAGVLAAPARSVSALKSAGQKVAARVVKGSTGGPDAEQRAGASCCVVARAFDARGELLHETILDGPDPYDFTAGILAWGAIAAAQGNLDGVGGLGPVGAFGLDSLATGCASVGLTARK